MVELPVIHQAVPLSRPHKQITVTIELCCALTGASRPEHTQGSARLYATETPMLEHPYAHPALHGGGKPAHSSSGSPPPTPYTNNVTLELALCADWCIPARSTPKGLHACILSRHLSLSTPKHTRHYPVVGNPLIHQAVPLRRHHTRITLPSS